MDLEKFKDWVYKEFKINLHAYKSNQLHRRLLSLMSRIGAKNVEEYINILEKDEDQRQKFLDFITINVTEFFRNPEIFEGLKNKIETDILSENKNLKVWSAACSIGAEPYSLAILLDELAPLGNHRIIATDLDEKILKRAKGGFYTQNDVKNIRKDRLDKYFKRDGEFYFINDKIKEMVNFKKHDLILDNYERNFDLIVCRNVVIYFKQDIKDKIYEKFNESLKKGGLLFVGATESIYNYKNFNFNKASTFIYKKA